MGMSRTARAAVAGASAGTGPQVALQVARRPWREEYVARTPGSERAYQRALRVTPGGVSHRFRHHAPYPLYVRRAAGSRIFDVDERPYLDLWMAHYDAILGHSPPEVVTVLSERLADGLHIGLPIEEEIALAEAVQRHVPSAERVRFCSSGTEASMYAVRVARAASGRSLIAKLTGGWHGANTDLTVGVLPPYDGPDGAGLPPQLSACTRLIPPNDIEGTAAVLAEAGADLAGVIVEPIMGAAGFLALESEYLHFLRETTKKADALLIFDEVISGFRLGLGGAQAVLGITPDLTCLGKVLGGGLPIGALAGRAEVMAFSTGPGEHGTQALIGGGTYSCNPLSMLAGQITLATLAKPTEDGISLYDRLARQNARLCEGIRCGFAQANIAVQVMQHGSLHEVHFLRQEGRSSEGGPPLRTVVDLQRRSHPQRRFELAERLRARGVFLYHGGALSRAHSDEDVEQLIVTYQAVAQDMAEDG